MTTESADLSGLEASLPELLTADSSDHVDPLAGVPAALADAIRGRGYNELTSVQRAVLDAGAEGRDLRISSQTGSGKTVAIGFALVSELLGDATGHRGSPSGPSVLVLVPTRELAMQVRDELGWLFAGVPGLGIEVVMGGTSVGLERRALARRPQVVVGTPGRALDHLQRGALVADQVRHVVLDESDRMLDMGFRDELEAILKCMPTERRTHLVSATFPAAVRKLADRFQNDALHIEGTRLGAANRDIEHVAHIVERREAHAAIVNLLLLNEGARCLIFVERRIDATGLAEKLSGHGFPVQSFSGELAQAQRTRTINAFRDGTIKTLVSTDVAARGIDVPDIELVIHVDTPESADTYVHRSGRTGRAGSAGRSVMLVAPRARRHVERLLHVARIETEWAPVPTVAKVERELRKRFRRDIHERLAAEHGPSQQQIDYAKTLLDGRDPSAVVALLLEMAQPKPARRPMDVREISAQAQSKADARPEGKPRSGRRAKSDFVTFTINWGEDTGAAASRVLGHVCRRGNIRSQFVGAITIGSDASSFDVDASVASEFEKAVKRPDARDPRLRVVRAGGSPARTSGGAVRVGRAAPRADSARGPGGRGKSTPAGASARPKKPFKGKGKGKGKTRS